jgi:channel protein (hemolysin III family)
MLETLFSWSDEMPGLHYDETTTKPWWRPRHPIVCLLDTTGLLLSLFFWWHATHWSVAVYLLCLAALYFFSGLHHWHLYRTWTGRIDHAMIFVVIAVSALPYWGALIPLPWYPAGPLFIGTIVVVGGGTKLVRSFPRVLSGVLYTLAGVPMVLYFLWRWDDIPAPYNSLWIIGVGLYMLQLMVYTWKWPNFAPDHVGYRDVQHVVLLCATTLHSVIALTLVG